MESKAIRTSTPFSSATRNVCSVPSGRCYNLISISQQARKNINIFLMPHFPKFSNPKMIPGRIIFRVRNSCIKLCLDKLPVFKLTDRLCQFQYVIVWICITKSFSYSMKKILTINVSNRTFGESLSQHFSRSINNPARRLL